MSFAERAAEKVRNAGQVAGAVQLFIRTDPFAQDAPQKSVSGSATFHRPTSDTRDIGAAVMRIFERIWREGYGWRKAGVLLLDLGAPGQVLDVFHIEQQLARPRSNFPADGGQLNRAVIAFNKRYPKPGFQRPQLLAQSWLRNMHRVRSAPKVPVICKGHEIGELAKRRHDSYFLSDLLPKINLSNWARVSIYIPIEADHEPLS
jgi:hypothetical protein